MGCQEKGIRRVLRNDFWFSLLFVIFIWLVLNQLRNVPCQNGIITVKIVRDQSEYLNCAIMTVIILFLVQQEPTLYIPVPSHQRP